ncbi:Hypothetical protein, putative [Bodo saltans]|uniref:WWE domain-containing protein n=1 Tax=Bodo saltans TaxID=75058 RepID=A0A0S4JTA0_BODSA|nr:Hypothetical protein, putative [Bodo saltans]|eukprot:CUG93464.1 Hypothetical protein, putative [Bodo saltans]
MPPKRTKFVAPDADKGTVPQWRFRNDLPVPDADAAGWTAYTKTQSADIELAYQRGLKTASIGNYFVDTKQKIQTHKEDILKTRKIRRFMVEPEELERGGKATVVGGPPTILAGPTKRATEVHTIDDDDGSKPAKVARAELPTTPLLPPVAATPLTPSTSSSGGVPTLPALPLDPSTIPTYGTLPSSSDGSVLSKRVPSASLDFPGRPEASTQPAVFLAKMVNVDTLQVIRFVLQDVPTINRKPLDDASVLIPFTRRWLKALGRPEQQQGVFITLPQPLATQSDARRVPVSETSIMTVQQARALADSAMVTYVGARPASLLLPNESQSKHASMAYKDHLKTQQLMISGLVRILYDGRYKPLPKPPVVVSCSAPGINFAYSDIDRHYFTKMSDDGDGATVLDKEKILKRMRLIWQHLLLVMDDKFRVQYPVLCAIGCGAFKGIYGAQIPRLWGRALAEVVCNSAKVLKNIAAIFVSLPTFGKDNNFAPFQHSIQEVLKDNSDVAYCPIVLIEDASMVDIAVSLTSGKLPNSSSVDAASAAPPVVGMLNPSDVQALRHGWVGMYWDGGHIALEEVLAMQTTLLLHHVGLNKSLYTDAKRLVPIKKVLPDMEE